MAHPPLVTKLRAGLDPGYNPLLSRSEDPEVGMDFGLQRLPAGQGFEFSEPDAEVALLVLSGAGEGQVDDLVLPFSREGWIEQGPFVLHGPAGSSFSVRAESDCELLLVSTANPDPFDPRVFRPEEVESEHRGKGLWDDMAYRIVRCAFDRRNSPPEARLVLGEVVNFPGRWSSYPPHHHPQPEIYYYRFSPPQGYGHGELGDEVFQLKDHDLLRITEGRDHSQVSAPGYHMYYLWAIRHLEGNPYQGFEYHPDHRWLLEEA